MERAYLLLLTQMAARYSESESKALNSSLPVPSLFLVGPQNTRRRLKVDLSDVDCLVLSQGWRRCLP